MEDMSSDLSAQVCDAPDDAIQNTSSCGLADEFLRNRCTDHAGRRTLRFWRGEFFQWDGSVYKRQYKEAIESTVHGYLRTLKVRHNSGTKQKPRYRNVLFEPEPREVDDVRRTLQRDVFINTMKMPCWTTDLGAAAPEPSSIIAFRNGLLDLEQFVRDAGLAALMSPTPEWFSENCLPFDFDWHARCPRWESFLSEALSNDAERISLLQEWFGYCMTADTRYQKMLWLHGRPGCGKGTVLRQFCRCLGSQNVATPTLTELIDKFGLEALLGKTAAMVTDAHLDRGASTSAMLDRILSITGEDPVNVQRKNRSTLTDLRLPIRFTVLVNSMPSMPDASNAIMRRLLLIPFTVNFEGREDRTLEGTLAKETPGVIAWALRGLLRLKETGLFTTVKAARPIVAQFRRANSPIEAFVRDAVVIGDKCQVVITTLYEKYLAWRRENGHKECSAATMGGDLHALGLQIERKRTGPRGFREWCYVGIGLRTDLDGDEDEDLEDETKSLF